MGFREPQVREALTEVRKQGVDPDLEPMLRAALDRLVSAGSAPKAAG
jgi:hypothetical protein